MQRVQSERVHNVFVQCANCIVPDVLIGAECFVQRHLTLAHTFSCDNSSSSRALSGVGASHMWSPHNQHCRIAFDVHYTFNVPLKAAYLQSSTLSFQIHIGYLSDIYGACDEPQCDVPSWFFDVMADIMGLLHWITNALQCNALQCRQCNAM